jgi:hypothetical protein
VSRLRLRLLRELLGKKLEASSRIDLRLVRVGG